jgi:hypothetical protein
MSDDQAQSKQRNHWPQIAVAVIGVVGVLGAAAIQAGLFRSDKVGQAAPALSTSASSSTSVSSTASVSASADPIATTRLPASPSKTGRQEVVGVLTHRIAAAPNGIDLTREGLSDWVHWGYLPADNSIGERYTGGWADVQCGDNACVNRKRRSAPLISNYTVVGGLCRPYRLRDREWLKWSWTDGTPTPAAPAAQGIVYLGVANCGFSFTVPAETTLRTLRLYVGIWNGRAMVTARLSDGSAAGISDTSFNSSDGVGASGGSGVIEIQYRARSAGQTLHLGYALHTDVAGGNVSLAAATLR